MPDLNLTGRKLRRASLCLTLLALMGGCTQLDAMRSPEAGNFYGEPRPLETPSTVGGYRNPCRLPVLDPLPVDIRPYGAGSFVPEQPLSPGDLLAIEVIDGKEFSGEFVVLPDQTLRVPFLEPISVRGSDVRRLAEKLSQALVAAQLFRAHAVHVTVRVLQWAPVEVAVSGAVFEPGRVLINELPQGVATERRMQASGDQSIGRSLSEALRRASGVRPDAKIDHVVLFRDGWQRVLDLSGMLSGATVEDVALAAGDRIHVPSVSCFQRELVRPSRITPRGFRVFLSNLTEPTAGNAAGAVGRFAENLPYGTRLLQAAVSANCVGGTQATNASRKVVLASTNPLDGAGRSG